MYVFQYCYNVHALALHIMPMTTNWFFNLHGFALERVLVRVRDFSLKSFSLAAPNETCVQCRRCVRFWCVFNLLQSEMHSEHSKPPRLNVLAMRLSLVQMFAYRIRYPFKINHFGIRGAAFSLLHKYTQMNVSTPRNSTARIFLRIRTWMCIAMLSLSTTSLSHPQHALRRHFVHWNVYVFICIPIWFGSFASRLQNAISLSNSISEFGIFDFKSNVINWAKFKCILRNFRNGIEFWQIQLSLLVDVWFSLCLSSTLLHSWLCRILQIRYSFNYQMLPIDLVTYCNASTGCARRNITWIRNLICGNFCVWQWKNVKNPFNCNNNPFQIGSNIIEVAMLLKYP